MASGNTAGIYYDLGRAIRIVLDFSPIVLSSLQDTLIQFDSLPIEDDT